MEANFGRKHQRYLVAMQYRIREDCLGWTQSRRPGGLWWA